MTWPICCLWRRGSVWSNLAYARSQLLLLGFFLQIQSGNIILYQLLTLFCVTVCCGVSHSAGRALDLVQLESSVWLQREWGKGSCLWQKNPLAIQGTVFVIVRISDCCGTKCDEKKSLVASIGIRHHVSLLFFSSHSVFKYKRKKHVEVCPWSPSMLDKSTALDLVNYSWGCWVRCTLQPQPWVTYNRCSFFVFLAWW